MAVVLIPHAVGRFAVVPEHFHPVLDEYLDIADQEKRRHVKDGTPILVDPDLQIDPRLVDYFARSDVFTEQDRSGRATYARELRQWLDFLWQLDLRWDEATEANYAQYKRWRTDPDLHEVDRGEEPPIVSLTTFNKSHAALKAFYAWAVAPRGTTSMRPPSQRSPASTGGGANPAPTVLKVSVGSG